MHLYYTPGACSLASHIALREAGIPVELEKVDLATRRTASGADFLTVNPNGYVPALQLDGGEILTEGAAILQYVADRAPAAGLAPAAGTMERYRLLEWLNFITSELHKNFSPLFSPDTTEATKDGAKGRILKRLEHVEKHLSQNDFLVGGRFSIADAYLFTVANWAGYVGLDISRFTQLKAFIGRVASRPAVQAALKAEGLI